MTDDPARYHEEMLLTATRPLKSRTPLSRFTRLAVPADVTPEALRVNHRVLGILGALATYRFLSTDQIARLHGGNPAYLRHLLRLMHRHGLILRPAGQAAYLSSFLHHGNMSLIYAITRRGVKILADHGYPVDPRLDWTLKNSGSGSHLFLAHQLQVAEFMLDCRLAMPSDGSLTLIDHPDLLPKFPIATQQHKFPYQLSVSVSIDDKPHALTITPDRLFRLQAAAHHYNYAYECDRGSESLRTRSKKLTSKATWFKKICGYYAAYRQKKFLDTWGFPALRVLTCTTSEERLGNMLGVQTAATNGAAQGMFLYTTPQRIAEHGVLGPAWRSARADYIQLIDS
jgi:hypothetical protein